MYSFSCLQLPTFISQTTIVSEKPVVSNFFTYKSIGDQIWPCRKIDQRQPRDIIWTNLVVLEYPMLHINFQGRRPFDSREEDFLMFLPYMDMAAILVIRPEPFEQIFVRPSHGWSTWNLVSIGLAVSTETKFENVESECPWTKVNKWPWPYIFI